jgi:hypothetical protein
MAIRIKTIDGYAIALRAVESDTKIKYNVIDEK